jgi:hypothetical protein
MLPRAKPVTEDDLIYTRAFAMGMFDHTDLLALALLKTELTKLGMTLYAVRNAGRNGKPWFKTDPRLHPWRKGWWRDLQQLCQRVAAHYGHPVTAEGNHAA